MSCHLTYIPDHLHTNGRPDINTFYVGELLYRRCKEEDVNNPFDSISLVDLSVNRKGNCDDILCQPDDVLYNLTPEKRDGERIDEAVSILEIKELTDASEYDKLISHEEDSCRISLKHEKTACMYAHCAFKIFFNGVETTFDNYKKGLGKKTQLRIKCKNELSRMIIKRELRINW